MIKMGKTNFNDKIEITKVSENNYTFSYIQPLASGGSKSYFQNIFIKDSKDYKEITGGLLKEIKPENIEGLKTVPKGKTSEESKRNLEAFIEKLLFNRIKMNKDRYVEVIYEDKTK